MRVLSAGAKHANELLSPSTTQRNLTKIESIHNTNIGISINAKSVGG